MEWKNTKLPAGSRLLRNHRFTFMHGGTNYLIEIDEQANGSCSGHAEQTTDSSGTVPSVSGKNVGECLQAIIAKIQEKFG